MNRPQYSQRRIAGPLPRRVPGYAQAVELRAALTYTQLKVRGRARVPGAGTICPPLTRPSDRY